MAVFPIVEEYVEKFVILNEIGQWESFRTEERIVRCRDCKYQRDCYCDHPKCSYMNAILPVELDGFCAWGEKVAE